MMHMPFHAMLLHSPIQPQLSTSGSKSRRSQKQKIEWGSCQQPLLWPGEGGLIDQGVACRPTTHTGALKQEMSISCSSTQSKEVKSTGLCPANKIIAPAIYQLIFLRYYQHPLIISSILWKNRNCTRGYFSFLGKEGENRRGSLKGQVLSGLAQSPGKTLRTRTERPQEVRPIPKEFCVFKIQGFQRSWTKQIGQNNR